MFLLRLFVAFLVPLIFGYLFCRLLFPLSQSRLSIGKWLLFFLGSGLGIGIYSLFFFSWLIIFGFPNKIYFLIELLPLVILVSLFLKSKNRRNCFANSDLLPQVRREINKKYLFFFCLISFFALLIFGSASYKHPHGAWDAWAHWNLKARFIFRGAEFWRDVFRPEIYLNRPLAEYPFLLPCAVARSWVYVGYDSVLVPITIAFIFTFCTAGLLASGVGMFKGKNAGLLSLIFLLSIPEFIRHGASQYADIEAAFFLLATIMILIFYNVYAPGYRSMLLLAGITAGLACWVKNEGLFFFPTILISRTLVRIREVPGKKLGKETFYFLVGLLPILLFIFYMKKLAAAPHQFLIHLTSQKIIRELLNFAKYPQIIKTMAIEIFNTDNWFIYPILMPVYLFLRGFAPIKISHLALFPLLAAGFILLTEFCIYVILPTESLQLHLITSLSRFYFQLWPLVLLCFFILLKADTVLGKQC